MAIKELFDLNGEVAIITGAARGIGRAISLGLAAHGANLILADRISANETNERVRQLGIECFDVVIDITTEDQVHSLVEAALKRFGKVDILVNNAGVIRRGPIEQHSKEYWMDVLNVNLIGTFNCVKAVLPSMKNNKHGKIINIASTGGEAGFRNAIAYNSSKGGVISFTKSMAIELAPYKINVNAISPNVVLTEMMKDRLSIKEEYEESLKRIPLGRYLEPEDLVGAAIFLASRASSMVTGHILHVDGGFIAM